LGNGRAEGGARFPRCGAAMRSCAGSRRQIPDRVEPHESADGERLWTALVRIDLVDARSRPWDDCALSVPGFALDISDIESGLPRTYRGGFHWVGDATVATGPDPDQPGPAAGYEPHRGDRVRSLPSRGSRHRHRRAHPDRRARARHRDQGFSPSGTGAPVFVTDGSHKGRLTDDLQTIETEWVTISNGQRGRLNLTAGGEVSCAGDQAGWFRPPEADRRCDPGRIAGPAGDPFRFDFFMPTMRRARHGSVTAGC